MHQRHQAKQVANHDPLAGLPKLAYSIEEAALVTSLSRAFIYAEWQAGRGPSKVKIGKRTLITDESLRSWLRSLERAKLLRHGEKSHNFRHLDRF